MGGATERWAYLGLQACGGPRFFQRGICLLVVELQMTSGFIYGRRREKDFLFRRPCSINRAAWGSAGAFY